MFIVSPRYGLCNQLQTIVKGILLGIKYNRNVYINKFQIDLENNKLCDINSILDIKSINLFLQNSIKTDIRLLNAIDYSIKNNLNNYCLPNIDYDNIQSMSFINDIIDLNENMEIIYLGNIISLNINQSFNYDYDDYSESNFYYSIMNNIKFNATFYKLKEYIKQELQLTKFNCVHLRIEDDALIHFASCFNLTVQEYNSKLLNFYSENIELLDQNKVYICSGMLEFNNNINTDYYNFMMKNNELLCDKKNIALDGFYFKNRELVAIIDLLIAYDSEYFIGCYISSFSQVIKNHFIYKKKKYILFTKSDI